MKGNIMNFAQAVESANNGTVTTNGATAYKSTNSTVLDFFGKAASMRGTDTSQLFEKALASNPEMAIRALLWLRDVRGGAGERKAFRDNLNSAMNSFADDAFRKRFVSKVVEVGRWDDLFSLFDTNHERIALLEIQKGLGIADSLCAKWMPRKGLNAEKIRKHLKLTPKQYRKLLVGLTEVVETKMCSNQWGEIEYQKVPSNAHNIYRAAFGKHSPEKYEQYKQQLKSGEVKINSSTLYPHQIVKTLHSDPVIANAQWKSLPDYVPENSFALPMIDLSSSMSSVHVSDSYTALDISVALGLYTATKSKGTFSGLWLNFSDNPQLYKLKTDNLESAYKSLDFNNWGGSTNIEAAFNLILQVAKENSLSQEDMPSTLIIFSDMQFNVASKGNQTTFKTSQKLFEDSGYVLPKIVFWNLCGSTNNVPVIKDESGAVLVSGFSPALMKSVLSDNLESFTPENMMLEVLMQDRYML